jgi:hypothetical protein
MAPNLQANDHYILRKLADELLPWMIGGRLVTRQWFVYVAAAYAYGGELATALTGIGVGGPLVQLFGANPPRGGNAADILQQALHGVWFWVGAVALAIWVMLRLVVGREDAVARALFAKDCARTMQKLQTDLDAELAKEAPLPGLAPIQAAVMRKVGDAIDRGVWRWDPPFPQSAAVDLELQRRIDDIRRRFMSRWPPLSGGGMV